MSNLVEYQNVDRGTIQQVVDRLGSEKAQTEDMIIPAHEAVFTADHIVNTDNDTLYPTVTMHRPMYDEKYMITGRSPLLRKAEQNLSTKLKMPTSFFDYLKESHPLLLQQNLNYLSDKFPGSLMVRSFRPESRFLKWNSDDQWPKVPNSRVIRSILSDRYKRINNFDVLNAVMKAIGESGVSMKVSSGSVTENHMFIDFVADNPQSFPDFLDRYRNPESQNRDTHVASGFSIRNSETGSSRFMIVPRMIVMACNNGMTIRKDAMARTHLGSKVDSSGILWSPDTVDKEMDLIIAQTSDAVKTFLSPEYLGQKITDIMSYRAELEHPHQAAQNLAKEFSFDEKETSDLVEALFGSGDRTTTGLLHASTWVAQSLEVERQYEVEEQAMQLLPVMGKFDRLRNN